MVRLPCLIPSTFLMVTCLNGSLAEESYPVHPDSTEKAEVPQGEVRGPFRWESTIYPGTVRDYWIYVPATYDPDKAACSLTVQDGLNRARDWNLPTVMDNLIHEGSMPVTIGIFINHGQVLPESGEGQQPRFNRSFEYDGMGDRYARFLLEEIFPEVSKDYHLSEDPNDRAIAGASSGAICAFTAAWERPDAFRRVLSTIGTYVGLRGGNAYPTLIRKTENKPIRVFLQDGSRDLDIYAGSWWMANQDMLSALTFAGYDVKPVWGEGGHNGKHARAILPDALHWLWRDYPQAIQPGKAPKRRTDILRDGDSWELVSEGHGYTEGPAVNRAGEVFFSDVRQSSIHKVDVEGNVSVFATNTGGANGLMMDAEDRLLACQMRASKLVRYDAKGEMEVLLENLSGNDLCVLPDGSAYVTVPRQQAIWHVDAKQAVKEYKTELEFPNGIIPTADNAFVWVADSRGPFVYSYRRAADGALTHGQRYGYLHCPDAEAESGADGMTVDTQGRLYVATKLGIQVLDQLGRVHFILNNPHPEGRKISNVVFGGPDRDILYATCTDRVYRRKVNATGVVPSQSPIKPPKPGL